MKQLGLVCHVRERRKYNSYKGDVGKVAPNLLERHFKTNEPNRKWVTDITEFKVNDQKLYLSPIIDLFNGEVISYTLSRHPNFKQVTDMLEDAFKKLPDKVDHLILHSDQGWQHQMRTYQQMLKPKALHKVCLAKLLVWIMLFLKTSSTYSRQNCSTWKNLIPLTNLKRLLLNTSTTTTIAGTVVKS